LAESDAPPAVTFKRIVCAVDFSECSLRALEYALSVAQEVNARLTVLHVIEPVPNVPAGDDSPLLGMKTVKEYIAAAEEEGRTLLRKAIPDCVRPYCEVEAVQTVGTPHREILGLATEQVADLIVLGVHGRSVVDLMFFGSTAQQVVRQGACPVLTLRT
jgi:nucleotide-binding universal stress UspA family protein